MSTGEALYPEGNGDVINVDTSLGEEFLHVAIGKAEAQVPAHSQQNPIGREPVPDERNGLNTAATIHLHTLPSGTRSVNARVSHNGGVWCPGSDNPPC